MCFGGTVGVVIGLSKGDDLSSLFEFFIMAIFGVLLLYWLNRQLYFKERNLSTSVEECREELYRVLEKEGWEFEHKTLKFCIAKKKNELLAVKFSKTKYKWCLTGDFMAFGPLFSIIPYYPKGMKVFKSLNLPDSH